MTLRCGVSVPAPSALVCQTIGGIDWIILEQEKLVQQMITYGRDPAVQVVSLRAEAARADRSPLQAMIGAGNPG